mgnify:CR=1 FL=1
MSESAPSPLFTPVRVGALQLPNRVVMAPMTRSRADAAGRVQPVTAEYYAQRASGGLLVTEATQVLPNGPGGPNTPGIHTDAQVEAWRAVTDAVHARGGRIVLQLWHAGRAAHPSFLPAGERHVAPSAVAINGKVFTPEGEQPHVTPHALTEPEIHDVIAAFGRGAANARRAGFDAVEVHGANGYLVDQFLRDGTNRRDDAWGGPVERRARFLLEVTRAVVDAAGADRTGVRLSPLNGYNDMADSSPEATFTYAAEQLDRFGLMYLHLVEPHGDGHPMGDPAGRRVAASLRRVFRGPLILNGGFDRAAADAVIGAGQADLVAFGVPYLANPDLPERLRDGAPLNAPDVSTFYGGGARGYTDYPTRDAAPADARDAALVAA